MADTKDRFVTSESYYNLSGILKATKPGLLLTREAIGYSGDYRLITESEVISGSKVIRYQLGVGCPVMPLSWYKLPARVSATNPIITSTDVQWFYSPRNTGSVSSGNPGIRLVNNLHTGEVEIQWTRDYYPPEINELTSKSLTITTDQLIDFRLRITSRSEKGTIVLTEVKYRAFTSNNWIGDLVRASTSWSFDSEVTISEQSGELILTDTLNNKFTITSLSPVLWSLKYGIVKYRDIRLVFDTSGGSTVHNLLNKIYCSNNLIL